MIQRLQELYHASQDQSLNAHEKGKKFEEFAIELFSTVDEFSLVDHNIRTNTSEIDLVFSYTKTPQSLLAGFNIDGHFLIQAKNRRETTSKDVVTSLVSEMLIRDCKFGIILTVSHVSSEGKDRMREHFLKNQLTIIAVEQNDIKKILKGDETLEKIISDKIKALRYF